MVKGEEENKKIYTYVYKHLCIYLHIKYKLIGESSFWT